MIVRLVVAGGVLGAALVVVYSMGVAVGRRSTELVLGADVVRLSQLLANELRRTEDDLVAAEAERVVRDAAGGASC